MEPTIMADTTPTTAGLRRPMPGKAWFAAALILLAIAVFDTPYFGPALIFTAGALGNTAGFIAFAVLAVSTLTTRKKSMLAAPCGTSSVDPVVAATRVPAATTA